MVFFMRQEEPEHRCTERELVLRHRDQDDPLVRALHEDPKVMVLQRRYFIESSSTMSQRGSHSTRHGNAGSFTVSQSTRHDGADYYTSSQGGHSTGSLPSHSNISLDTYHSEKN
jgi:hypothetical protein